MLNVKPVFKLFSIPLKLTIKRKSAFEHAQNPPIQVILHMRKVPFRTLICSSFIYSVVSKNSDSGQWRPWTDCANAQSVQGLRCPHMPEDTLSQSAIHIMICSISVLTWLNSFIVSSKYGTHQVDSTRHKGISAHTIVTKFQISLRVSQVHVCSLNRISWINDSHKQMLLQKYRFYSRISVQYKTGQDNNS